ncbi:MAG: glycosyl hydrolase [Kiritimatiellae bacterium]|nr:glycosyl hydrolase [Kiritimatiellia bacterium]
MNIKNQHLTQRVRAMGWVPLCLFAAFALQSKPLLARESGSVDSVAAKSSDQAMEPDRSKDQLSPAAFAEPPLNTRPGAYWDWLNGAITREQITRDLEAMKQGGMRGAEIWDVAAAADPDRRVPGGPAFLGPESTQLIAHAIREADRLGLEIGIIGSSGWNAGGSWVTPEHAGKGLYRSITTATGNTEFHAALPMPELPGACPRDAQGQPIYLREVAVLAVPHDTAKTLAAVSQVIDLTKQIEPDGRLRWSVPAGEWDIIRFVCTNHGQQLIVPSPKSLGPMIDFFDPRATEFHLRHIANTILKELGRTSFEGSSFKTLEFDSMELGGFTPWSEAMDAEFQRRIGYPVIRFLPLLAGWKLADGATQQQFLYDWRKLVSDLLIDSHYVTGRKVLGSYGLKLVAESGGPGPPVWNSNPVDGIKALGAVDIPRGEFWIRHREIFLVKEIASAAHVYNKRLVDAEAFTTWRRWVDGPLNHKELADRALCEGLNCFSLHTFASTPPEAGLPGWAYHAGTDINPSATWWPMVRGLMDYLARCSYMLRQGWFVGDVCYYYGDQAPNFYPLLCNVPERPLLTGLDPRNDYDVCTSEVILQRMRVENNRIVLPDGMSYAAIVLPEQDHIPSEVLEKIRVLVSEGATVIAHQRPTRAPGMKEQEIETQKVLQLVDELWGADDPSAKPDKSSVLVRSVRAGRLVVASDRSAALRKIGVAADFEIAGRSQSDLGPLDFIHRRTTEDEFYFIRNKTKEAQTLICLFRVAAQANGQVPEFWWPDSGRRSVCHTWRSMASGQTELPVTLGPLGSVFVVFRKANAAKSETLDPVARDTFPAAESPAPLALDGAWQVEFPEGWGAPTKTTFEKLQSWTESDDEGIRFFSGIAFYRKSFELPESLAKQSRLFLELGDLAEIAEVTLNGKRLGLVWLPPYRIEISGVARAGANQLEIRIANLWANRLNGDSLRPEATRFTRSNLDRIQTDSTSDSNFGQIPGGAARPVYKEIPPLMKSGLFGPVKIITPRE